MITYPLLGALAGVPAFYISPAVGAAAMWLGYTGGCVGSYAQLRHDAHEQQTELKGKKTRTAQDERNLAVLDQMYPDKKKTTITRHEEG